MTIVNFFRVGGLVAGPGMMLLAVTLAGCSQKKATPVGGVLEYDPANDPTISAAESYMEKENNGQGMGP